MDLFTKMGIAPMLLNEESQPFNSDQYLYELKFDGTRTIVYVDKDYVQLQSKRMDKLIKYYPELLNIGEFVKGRAILDGEMIILENGRVNFFKMQQRSLQKNSIKIKFLSQKEPVTFVAFDILYLDGKDLTNLPLLKRRKYLEKIITPSSRIAISKAFESGIELFQIAKKNQLEGIVAKLKSSKYQIGKRSNDWIKIKNLMDEDLYIIGYSQTSDSAMASIYCARKIKSEYVYVSSVTIGRNNPEFKKIQMAPKVDRKYYDILKDGEFIKPVYKATIMFMEYTPSYGLRQPIFKNLVQ